MLIMQNIPDQWISLVKWQHVDEIPVIHSSLPIAVAFQHPILLYQQCPRNQLRHHPNHESNFLIKNNLLF